MNKLQQCVVMHEYLDFDDDDHIDDWIDDYGNHEKHTLTIYHLWSQYIKSLMALTNHEPRSVDRMTYEKEFC